jgi:antirestriction protein
MTKANRVHSTPRRTASKIKAEKRARKADLAAAAAELTAVDASIEAMHKKYGDEADSRKDYRRLSRRRFDLLRMFGSTPALSLGDVEAKAAALSRRTWTIRTPP